eukprot:4427389-Pyramimonas_sp.AAC.1
MDNADRVNVAVTRATRNVIIIGDGRMFATATGSRLRELSEYGRFAKLWVRFQHPGQNGSRWTLIVDEAFDPIADLTSWIPESPSHAGDEIIEGLDHAIVKARASMENNFADQIAAPLDPELSWTCLCDAIRGSRRARVTPHPHLLCP